MSNVQPPVNLNHAGFPRDFFVRVQPPRLGAQENSIRIFSNSAGGTFRSARADRQVLHSAIAKMHRAVRVARFVKRQLQGIRHQARPHRDRHAPTDYLPRKGANDECRLDTAFPCRNGGELHHPATFSWRPFPCQNEGAPMAQAATPGFSKYRILAGLLRNGLGEISGPLAWPAFCISKARTVLDDDPFSG